MKLHIPSMIALAASAILAFSTSAMAQPGPHHYPHAAPPAAHHHHAPPPRYHKPPPPPHAHHRPPQQRFVNWCDHPRGYYPDVRHCRTGWHRIPAHPRRY